jgi:hypothetical protein
MCKISVYEYTCKHRIQHVWSACRGQVKVAKDSNHPACQKSPSLYVKTTNLCGSCSRAEAEQNIRRELDIANNSAETQETLERRIADVVNRIPTSNWRPVPSPVYNHRPSQKRLQSRRKHSLLREEVKAEDMCGPEAWEDNVVLPVYEAVDYGWDYEVTPDTKSLADEIAEDKAERSEEEKDEPDEEERDEADEEERCEADGEERDEADREEKVEADGEEKVKADGKDDRGPCGIRYRFRQHKICLSGRKVGVQSWELVEVQAN